ncbi:hypothetical protein RMSM_04718 [Rhodopirellula maiorica SM1]|uniref:Uncharacterized protein n=1 Tax=Rhodopirellula maiorica SM1 TaxID=1265738 RepID=M5RGU9_9BACT|nr:hypothetical protein RMSM_04718 [Rhodopirellula maiorica SM1]
MISKIEIVWFLIILPVNHSANFHCSKQAGSNDGGISGWPFGQAL